ncbi:FAD-dependent oxidoreductase [Candidatus Nomurabacteria bacterium]|nr:FAD-dependent oxidoreductase [Candidatus Nomurabacteria bacterium]
MKRPPEEPLHYSIFVRFYQTAVEPSLLFVCYYKIMNPDYDYIVVGAGIAGLGAAYTLSKKGGEVLVLESQSSPGGRMKTNSYGGKKYEAGAGFILPHFKNIRALADELGCKIVPIPKTKNFTFMISDKRYLFDLAKDEESNFAVFHIDTVSEMVGVPFLSKQTKMHILMRVGRLYAKLIQFKGKSATELSQEHDISIYNLLKKQFGKDFADNIIDPIVYGAFTYSAKEMSANLVFANLGDLMKTQYQTFEGGIGELNKRLAENLNVSYDSEVEKISKNRDRDLVEINFTTPVGAERLTARKVIVAVPGDKVLSLINSPTQCAKDFFDKVRYSSTARIFCTSNTDSFKLTNQFIISSSASQKIASVLVKRNVYGSSEIEAVLRKEFAQQIISKNDVDLMVEIREDLSQILQEDFTIDKIHRWSSSLPIFYPGYLEAIAEFKSKITSEDQILFAGDYLDAPFSEGALRSGLEAAKHAIGQA